VTRRNIDVGDLVDAGNGGGTGRALFSVAQVDPLRLYVYVPQTYASQIKIGDPVTVTLAERRGEQYQGTIARTARAIDTTTRTMQVEIRVPERGPKAHLVEMAVGNAQACLDAAVPYAQQRHAFGVPIGTFQMIKKDIAEMTAHVAAARLLVYQLAWLMDMGKPCAREASIAKLFASEVGLTVALRAQFIHGAYGFSKEYPIAGRLVEAQFLRIAEGTSNIHRLIIADDALGYKKADRE
jgi:hypothetical protein